MPSMEEQEIYRRFDLEKPWNDRVNETLATIDESIFHCPSSHASPLDSDYFAVVGPGTLWPESGALNKQQVTDGLSNTIALIEVHGRNVRWPEPCDLTVDEALMILTSDSDADDGHLIKPSFLHREIVGRNIAFADGRAIYLNSPLDRKLAAALLTANGGEELGNAVQKLREEGANVPLDWFAVYSLCVFTAVSLLPLAKVFRATD